MEKLDDLKHIILKSCYEFFFLKENVHIGSLVLLYVRYKQTFINEPVSIDITKICKELDKEIAYLVEEGYIKRAHGHMYSVTSKGKLYGDLVVKRGAI